MERLCRVRPDDQAGVDRHIVELGKSGELRRDKLDVIPGRERRGGDPHCHHRTMMPDAVEATGSELVNFFDVRLIRGAVVVLIHPLIYRRVVRLWIVDFPRSDLVGIYPDHAVLDPGRELVEDLRRVIGRNAGVEPVVPVVHSTYEVVATNRPIREERASMKAAAVEDGHIVVVADDDQVDIADQRGERLTIAQVVPFRDLDHLHCCPLVDGSLRSSAAIAHHGAQLPRENKQG